MSEALFFLGPALVICLVIAVIHVYLGMHVLEREVIFVDLSLAALAALGAAATTLFDIHEGGWRVHAAAFGFAAAGEIETQYGDPTRHQALSQRDVLGAVFARQHAMTADDRDAVWTAVQYPDQPLTTAVGELDPFAHRTRPA